MEVLLNFTDAQDEAASSSERVYEIVRLKITVRMMWFAGIANRDTTVTA